jgi:hypothetical protein
LQAAGDNGVPPLPIPSPDIAIGLNEPMLTKAAIAIHTRAVD